MLAYCWRKETLLPTPQDPNSDFLEMRKRVKLRDIFWYRKPAPAAVILQPGADPRDADIALRKGDVENSPLDGLRNKFRLVWRGLNPLGNRGARRPASAEDNENLPDMTQPEAATKDNGARTLYPATFLRTQSDD